MYLQRDERERKRPTIVARAELRRDERNRADSPACIDPSIRRYLASRARYRLDKRGFTFGANARQDGPKRETLGRSYGREI
jgi:hypothetical protein